MPFRQTRLWQSVPDLQVLPSAQESEHEPPQSTSVSALFLTLSVQLAAWHLAGVPEHTPLSQSFAPEQPCVAPHLGHDEPQSMSVSVPFLILSLQMGAWHFNGDPVHTPL
jgi:hypothetical protein